MKNHKHTISSLQLFFVIIQAQIGVGLLSLPYAVHKNAQNDGWISVLLAGLGVFLFFLIMWSLGKRFPKQTLYEYLEKIVGKTIGKFISFLYILFFCAVSIFVVEITVLILKKWILSLTPSYVLVLIVVGTGVYMSRESIRVIGRFYTFVSVLIIFLIFLEICSLAHINVRYLFPIGQSGVKNILLGSHDALVSMLGFEVILVVFPFVNASHKEIFKKGTMAISFVTILYTFFLIVSYMSFSKKEIEIIPEPILYSLKALSYEVVERLDLVFLSIWVVPILTSFVNYLYLTSMGISSLIRSKNHKKPTFYVGLFIAVVAFLVPQEERMVERFGSIVSNASYVFIFAIPFSLLIVSIIRNKKEMG